MKAAQTTTRTTKAKPVIKWAGGKGQLLADLHRRKPERFSRYIEPFIGGGAFFFDLMPDQAIIADSNPELVNLYRCLRDDYPSILSHLITFKNEEYFYYALRSKKFESLEPFYAAARTIFLNRTCFNGLYRVNKKGEFNVPFGRYKNPNFCDLDVLRSASHALQGVTIDQGDYLTVLKRHAKAGDFIFLDPPYLPISEYADFKRYTKEQFYEEDHWDLAAEVRRLQQIGCHVVLTNSNHPLVHELYKGLDIEVVRTKRNISSRASSRLGEDVIVTAKPIARAKLKLVPKPLPAQVEAYPSTRYMGSKEKLLPHIKAVLDNFEFNSAVDLFAGTGVVGYMMKAMGKEVVSNDYMAMSSTFARAMIENSTVTLDQRDIDSLFAPNPNGSTFVQDTFEGLYYTNAENAVIDLVRSNIQGILNPVKRSLALSALMRACLKKRARGIFTYTGLRYDDGRADLVMSMEEQIRRAADAINSAVFDNGRTCSTRNGDAMSFRKQVDLAYIDPPYYSPLSDNEYVRRYHFIEGLARDWQGVDMQWHTKTRKFKSYPTPFSSRIGASEAFDALFRRLRNSILVVSYSSNSEPGRDEIVHLMSKYKARVEVVEVDYRYSFANQRQADGMRNDVQEYLFVGY